MPPPESLASRAETLLNRLAQVEAQEADQQARVEIEKARVRASRTREDLDSTLRVIPLLAEHGLSQPAVRTAAAAELAKARTALRTAATTIVGAPIGDVASRIRSQSVNNALDTAGKFARSLLADLNRSVDAKRMEIRPDGVEQPIVAYPGASDALAARLRWIQSLFARKVENLSPDDLVKRLQDIVNGAASWTSDRPKLDQSLERQHPEVSEFLRQAASEHGAPWRLITPAVHTWLSDPENTVNLRIVLRS
ncbi:hypothetical protein AB0K40_23430 [Nonomuraea bangladeshensis]|uniref:Uncharacterized protein n=1 Tax=Nonomuraea bangladeshensis TaxID=404385 RepID=A0ABV3H7I1_9ACTN